MRFYIIEDDQAVIDTLEDLIEQQSLGSVCGDSGGGDPDEQSVLSAKPDIVLIDFLMPNRDGVQIVQSLKRLGCGAKCVMISQISDKALIGKAYHAGVDFFISKPINAIEVQSVIRTIAGQIQNERTIASIRNLFGERVPTETPRTDVFLKRARLAMNQLGMSGEKGCIDILKICQYLHDNKLSVYQANFGQICACLSSAPQSMEQRVRRAIAKGMRNLAQLGIEDYMNETFVEYSGSLFPFEEVKAEMDYIRRKQKRGGKVNVKSFVGGLLIRSEQDEGTI